MHRSAAPRIGRLVPLAEYITRLTGISSFSDRWRLDISEGPARQLCVSHGSDGEVVGLTCRCVSVSPEVLLPCRDSDCDVGLWW